jgi:surface carbohydrate biosynthesis protein
MVKLRVAIIVDNPKRDLAANTLLGVELVNRGYEVFLVPLYIQSRELLAIRPNITILNYHRKGSDWLVEFVLKLKSKVFILETEGAVFADFNKTKELYSTNEEVKSKIDGYFIWGNTIYENFINHKIYPEDKLFLTGSPRTDLLADKYKTVVAKILEKELNQDELKVFKKRYFLINANNALINGILSNEQETRVNLNQTFGYDWNYIDSLLKEQHERLKALIQLTKKLAISFPNETFIIRPHPFEKKETYRELSELYSNVHVINSGSIDGWLFNCKGVVMKNCSTSLEASLAGVPVINIDWLNHKHNVVETEKISKSAKSEDDIIILIKKILNNEFHLDVLVTKERDKIIQNMYYSNDGKNHLRIADVIDNNVKNWTPRKLTLTEAKSLNHISGGLSNKIKKLLKLNQYLSLSTFKLKDPNKSWTKTSFYFGEKEVQNILSNLKTNYKASVNFTRFGKEYPFVRSVLIE